MLAVPTLYFVGKLSVQKAHATAILTVLPLCAVSAICYFTASAFDWHLTLWVGSGAVVGGAVGALLLKKLPGKAITLLFSALMVGAGIYSIIGG